MLSHRTSTNDINSEKCDALYLEVHLKDNKNNNSLYRIFNLY